MRIVHCSESARVNNARRFHQEEGNAATAMRAVRVTIAGVIYKSRVLRLPSKAHVLKDHPATPKNTTRGSGSQKKTATLTESTAYIVRHHATPYHTIPCYAMPCQPLTAGGMLLLPPPPLEFCASLGGGLRLPSPLPPRPAPPPPPPSAAELDAYPGPGRVKLRPSSTNHQAQWRKECGRQRQYQR